MQFAVMVMSITVMMQAVVLHFQIKELRELANEVYRMRSELREQERQSNGSSRTQKEPSPVSTEDRKELSQEDPCQDCQA